MSESEEEVTVDSGGVTVKKSLNDQQFETLAVVFDVRAGREEAAYVTLTDEVPDGVPIDDVGFHPEYGSEHWRAEESQVVFGRTFEPGEQYTTVYGVRDFDGVRADLLSEPGVEVGPPREDDTVRDIDDLVSEEDSQVVREVISGERDTLPGLGDDAVEAPEPASDGTDATAEEAGDEPLAEAAADEGPEDVEAPVDAGDEEPADEPLVDEEPADDVLADVDDLDAEVAALGSDGPGVDEGEDDAAVAGGPGDVGTVEEPGEAVDDGAIAPDEGVEGDEVAPAGEAEAEAEVDVYAGDDLEADADEAAEEAEATDDAVEAIDEGAEPTGGEQADAAEGETVEPTDEEAEEVETMDEAPEEYGVEVESMDEPTVDVEESPVGEEPADEPETGVGSVVSDVGMDEGDDYEESAETEEPTSEAEAEAAAAEEEAASDDEITVPVTGGIARVLAKELRAGNVSYDDRRLLREELLPDEGSTDARIARLQNEVADLAAYTEALEEFLDEEGGAEAVIGRLEERVDSLAADVEAVEETVGYVREDVESVADDVDEVEDDVESVEAGLGAVRDDVDAVSADVEQVDGAVERVEGDLDAVRDDLARLDEVDRRVDGVRDDVAAIHDELDDLATFRERLSSVFGSGGMGEQADEDE